MIRAAAGVVASALLVGTALAGDLAEIKAGGVLRVIAQRYEAPELFNLGSGEPGHSAFAVRKSDSQLLASLDEYLGNFRRSPSWNRLLVKYFGDQALTVLGRR